MTNISVRVESVGLLTVEIQSLSTLQDVEGNSPMLDLETVHQIRNQRSPVLLYTYLMLLNPSTMTEQSRTEEVAIQCAQCGAIYPALRLPGGKLTRPGNRSVCCCGNGSFVELNDN